MADVSIHGEFIPNINRIFDPCGVGLSTFRRNLLRPVRRLQG
jgi:hypothetical protein